MATGSLLRLPAPARLAPPGCQSMASSAKAAKNKVVVAQAGSSSNPAVTVPPLGPVGTGDSPIDDYGREGKRTPQQHIIEATVAKNYSRLKMAQDKALHADLNRRIRLTQEAIAALPEHLQEEARTPDMADFPPHRPIPGAAIVVSFEEHTDEIISRN